MFRYAVLEKLDAFLELSKRVERLVGGYFRYESEVHRPSASECQQSNLEELRHGGLLTGRPVLPKKLNPKSFRMSAPIFFAAESSDYVTYPIDPNTVGRNTVPYILNTYGSSRA